MDGEAADFEQFACASSVRSLASEKRDRAIVALVFHQRRFPCRFSPRDLSFQRLNRLPLGLFPSPSCRLTPWTLRPARALRRALSASLTQAGTFSDGAGFRAVNLSLSKRIPVGELGERGRLHVRWETFNHTNFGPRNLNVNGKNGAAIISAQPARVMQLGLRYQF